MKRTFAPACAMVIIEAMLSFRERALQRQGTGRGSSGAAPWRGSPLGMSS